MILFKLQRTHFNESYIIGTLSHNYNHLCNTLEPTSLRCPTGDYQLDATYSTKFNKILPELVSVPGRTGIRIHPGNTVKDTTGCILVGVNSDVGTLTDSTIYVEQITDLINSDPQSYILIC
jgi:hypothetical protein